MDKINFANLPSTTTPINATNLNQLQTNVDNGKVDKTIIEYSGDLNELKTTGYYFTTNTATNKPDSNNYYVEVIRRDVNYVLQIAHTRANSPVGSVTYERQCYNGTWGSWDVFPVTTTNENGTAIRFADGTMICRGIVEVSSSDSLPFEKNLPLSFIDTGRQYEKYGTLILINIFASTQNIIWTGSIASGNKISVRQTVSTTGQRSNNLERAAYVAIGRWK